MKLVFEYFAVLATLIAMDVVWLTVTKGFYASQIGHLLAQKVSWWAVVLFYLFYAGAIVFFALHGATSTQEAVLRGAVLGFTAYMTYDLVNAATLSGWPLKFAVVDITWGVIITSVSVAVASLI
jgi:uncharacterized membrane protein